MANLQLKVLWICFALVGSVTTHETGSPHTHGQQDGDGGVPGHKPADTPASSSPPIKTQLVECDSADDVMPYWSDANCRTYFVCHERVPYMYSCPVTMAFSAERNECVQWHEIQCSAQNKAVWLAMEAQALIRDASSPSYMFSRGDQGGKPKPMIDTRRIQAHKLKTNVGLEKMKRIQGLLMSHRGHTPLFADASAYTGTVVPVILSGQFCSKNDKTFDRVQTTSLLNDVLQAETRCHGRPAECQLPYLDVRCEGHIDDDGQGDSSSMGDNERLHDKQHPHSHHSHRRGEDEDEREEHKEWETEEETVRGEELVKDGKKDEAVENETEFITEKKEDDTDGLMKRADYGDITPDPSNSKPTLAATDGHADDEDTNMSRGEADNAEHLTHSSTRFSVWATEGANGYEIEDSNTEIRYPYQGGSGGNYVSDPEADAANKKKDMRRSDDEKSDAEKRDSVEDSAADKRETSANSLNEKSVFGESDVFDLRDHIEKTFRESLEERLGKE